MLRPFPRPRGLQFALESWVSFNALRVVEAAACRMAAVVIGRYST